MGLSIEHTVLRPRLPEGVEPSLVRLSPDRLRLAFVCTLERRPAVYLGEALSEALAEPVQEDGPEPLEVVALPGARPADLVWSPDGAYLAYRTTGLPPGHGDRIGWAASTEPGELGRVHALAFAWAPSGPVLYAADADGYELSRVDVSTGQPRPLAELIHFRDPRFWPRIAPSPDGRRIVFTTRNETEDTARVYCVERKQGERVAELVTWIPGANVHVLPFWSPKGRSLALHLVHVEQERTGLVVVRHLQGEGEIVYQHEAIDGAVTPAWAPDGRRIALYRHEPPAEGAEREPGAPPGDAEDPATFPTGAPAQPMPDQQLVLLDLATGSCEPLAETGTLTGDLRFLDEEHLLVDGGAAVHVLRIETGA